jgi:3-oxoacyl-[acyl-carrier protein] reductase
MIESGMVKKVSRTVVREAINSIPLKRLGRCEEVANTIIYLSSSASSYIVGKPSLLMVAW